MQNVIMALPNAHSWKAIREELKRCFSDQTSLGHAATQLENMTQKPNEPLRLYIFRYSKIHKSVLKRDACYERLPFTSKLLSHIWVCLLSSELMLCPHTLSGRSIVS